MSGRSRSFAALAAVVLGAEVVRAGEGAAPSEAAGVQAFGEVARVLSSPRCRNCHPVGDAPLQGDDPPHPHAMNISRISTTSGLLCTACHRETNNPSPGAPPGAADWHMPSAKTPMVFEGLTPRQLCLSLKDTTKNGGRDLPALRTHLASDPLVLWGFSPGPGRAKPPVSHADFVKSAGVWIDAGAPCPL